MGRIFIKRTKEEWQTLSGLSKKSGLPRFVRMEISRLLTELEKNPDFITDIECDKVQKEFLLPENEYSEYVRLSVKLKKPVSSIIDQFVISPLLLPK